MGYSAEVITRARARLEQARSQRTQENDARLRQAYQKVPRLREIDRQLRLNMATAMAEAFSEGSDAVAALNRARRDSQSLQAERAWLVDANFEEGWLDDTPICTICKGTGYVGSSMCECLAELCRQEQKKELTMLTAGRETFDNFKLHYYPAETDPELGVSPRLVMEKALKICKNYALNFGPESGNLLLSGAAGLGKPHLSACMARAVADGGHSVVYEPASHIFSALERAHFGKDPADALAAKKYTQCDLLVIDDLGTEMAGPFVVSALYTVINDRLLRGAGTIISTNLGGDEIARRYSPQIASRLLGSYRRVPFVGKDIRLLKAKGL